MPRSEASPGRRRSVGATLLEGYVLPFDAAIRRPVAIAKGIVDAAA
ncbi:MAG: hypothetical protein QOJ15_8321 [Bradyrhizobium sp.]|jgi:hypothetical protein|nr:hypothetical protein [Bradyrhizobium sp.]